MGGVIRRIYKFIQLLSLDVVLGAVGGGVMAASLLKVTLPLIWWVAFPIAVWVVYTADHLIDAYRLGSGATTDRHRFHVKYFHPLLVVWLIFAAISILVVPWLVPIAYLWLALLAGGLTVIHFSLVWLVKDRVTPWLAKEIGVAFVYSSGVWGGALALADQVTPAQGVMIGQFFLLALINLLTFAMYEEMTDQKDGFTSWARGLGKEMSRRVLMVLAGIVIATGSWVFCTERTDMVSILVEGTFLVMWGILLWVAFDMTRFSRNDLYRLIADGAFLLPLAWLFHYLIPR